MKESRKSTLKQTSQASNALWLRILETNEGLATKIASYGSSHILGQVELRER